MADFVTGSRSSTCDAACRDVQPSRVAVVPTELRSPAPLLLQGAVGSIK